MAKLLTTNIPKSKKAKHSRGIQMSRNASIRYQSLWTGSFLFIHTHINRKYILYSWKRHTESRASDLHATFNTFIKYNDFFDSISDITIFQPRVSWMLNSEKKTQLHIEEAEK